MNQTLAITEEELLRCHGQEGDHPRIHRHIRHHTYVRCEASSSGC